MRISKKAERQLKHSRFDCTPGCPVEAAINIIEGKWKAVILWHLLEEGVLRFNEIRQHVSRATPRMISKQLQELEVDQLVHREVVDASPPRVEYRLTELGLTLQPILTSLKLWGEEHIDLYGRIR